MSKASSQPVDLLFQALIAGDRPKARAITREAARSAGDASRVLDELLWPVLIRVQNTHRDDDLSRLRYQYATRLLRQLFDQLQPELPVSHSVKEITLVVSGEEQSEELAAQMCADLLESQGFQVYYCGGGIANDEIVSEVGRRSVDRLVIFGAVASTVPATRMLIDHLHEIGVAPRLQIIVGGGVFNRAAGLAEEIGADLWADTPTQVVDLMVDLPEHRMDETQRTVGRKRQVSRARSAAARKAA